MTDFEALAWAKERREDFPVLDQEVAGKKLLYLDNAATTQKPREVIAALAHYYERDNSNVHRGLHELSNRATAAYEGARKRAAEFINASSPSEIVFTRGTTEGINLIANTWGAANLGAHDIILLSEMEHHSNLVPWQLLAERTGAELRFIPVTMPDAEALDLSELDELLDGGRVKLLACTHVSNTLGVINPVHRLCEAARKRGITTLIDAAQSAGHAELDVKEIGCDFLVFSGHKMVGPTGIGVLFGRNEILKELPPWHGGGEMISTVSYMESAWKPAPYRFEAGTPHICGAIGLAAAMDYLEKAGRRQIAQHDRALADYAMESMSELPFLRLLGPRPGMKRAGMVTFTMEGVHAHDVVEFANSYGIALRGGHHCNQPLMKKLGTPSTARASFYLYNLESEIDTLVDALQKIHQFFN